MRVHKLATAIAETKTISSTEEGQVGKIPFDFLDKIRVSKNQYFLENDLLLKMLK